MLEKDSESDKQVHYVYLRYAVMCCGENSMEREKGLWRRTRPTKILNGMVWWLIFIVKSTVFRITMETYLWGVFMKPFPEMLNLREDPS